MLVNLPPFHLTPDQRAAVDAVSSPDARTMYLQQFHQEHAWKHRAILGAFGSLDPAAFTRSWQAREAEFMEAAWADYRSDEDIARPSESTVLLGMVA